MDVFGVKSDFGGMKEVILEMTYFITEEQVKDGILFCFDVAMEKQERFVLLNGCSFPTDKDKYMKF